MLKLFGIGELAEQAFIRRNFLVNVGEGALYSFAMSFVSLQTILPVFVKNAGGSNVAIGLIPVIWMFGLNFPQIFIARHAQRSDKKRTLFLQTALIQRVPWLFLSLFALFFLDRLSTGTALALFFVLLSLAAVGGSIHLPVWFDFISKITPVRLRGRTFGVRSIFGSLLGLAGGAIAALVLSFASYPINFGLLFLLAFVFMMVSYALLFLFKDSSDHLIESPLVHQEFMKTLKRILVQEINFKNFLIADVLMLGASMGNAFFAVAAFDRFSLGDEYAGVFTMVMMLSTALGGLVLGYVADSFGHKINLIIASIAMLLASLIALAVQNVEAYLFVFACSAWTIAVTIISRLPMIAEICGEKNRPTYIALANMITSPFVLLGVVAGWAADAIGYNVVFAVSMILALSSIVWLSLKVIEPRRGAHVLIGDDQTG